MKEAKKDEKWVLFSLSHELQIAIFEFLLLNKLKLTSIASPGVLFHNQIAYPGMHNIDESAVNHPNAWAHHGNS